MIAVATLIARYIRGVSLIARMDNSGNKAHYETNGHGDVVNLMDSAGAVLNQYTYDIWGNPLTTSETVQNPFRYSGEYIDKTTSLQYLRSRWYDPSVGRFINEDTYEGDINDPLSENLYTYVENNPLTYDDPTGHWCQATVSGKEYSHPDGCDNGTDHSVNSGPGYSDNNLHDGSPIIFGGIIQGYYTCVSCKLNMDLGKVIQNTNPSPSTPPPVNVGTTIALGTGEVASGSTVVSLDVIAGIAWPLLIFALIPSSDISSGPLASKNNTVDDGTPLKKLKYFPSDRLDELNGEGYTAGVKATNGKSTSNLKWNPRTGKVYTQPNAGGQPQWVDTVRPR